MISFKNDCAHYDTVYARIIFKTIHKLALENWKFIASDEHFLAQITDFLSIKLYFCYISRNYHVLLIEIILF